MSASRTVENFGRALSQLREFVALPVVNDRDRAGIIQAFEFTFEQSWKAFQKIAGDEGLAATSPRQALLAAVQLQLIVAAEEETWLSMLQDRNRTSHLYQESVAREIVDRIAGLYLPLLRGAHQRCVKAIS
jgi:nucleotidyltransferase substrate binding protein (TIGR01987 family)